MVNAGFWLGADAASPAGDQCENQGQGADHAHRFHGVLLFPRWTGGSGTERGAQAMIICR